MVIIKGSEENSKDFLLKELKYLRKRTADLESQLAQQATAGFLLENESIFKHLVSNSNDMIVRIGKDGLFSYVNSSVKDLLSYDPSDMVGKPFSIFLTKDSAIVAQKYFQGFQKGEFKNDTVIFKFDALRQDGTEIAVLSYTRALQDTKGNFFEIISVVRHVSRRKEFHKNHLPSEETSLNDSPSEEIFRKSLESIPHSIQEIDLSGLILFANTAYCEMLDYEEGELTGKYLWDYFVNEPEMLEAKQYSKVVNWNQITPAPYYCKMRTKNNRIIDIQVDWNYKKDDEGNVTGFISIVSDITERKRDERELIKHRYHLETIVARRTIELTQANESLQQEIIERKNIEEILRKTECEKAAILDSMSEHVIYLDGDNQVVWANRAATTTADTTPDKIVGIHVRKLSMYHDASNDKWMVAQAVSTGISKNLEITRDNGKVFFIRVYPIYTDSYDLEGTVLISLDITQRKQAEERLRFGKERLSLALEGADEGLWDWNLKTNETFFSSRWYTLLGYVAHEFHPSINAWFDLLHPDDRETIEREFIKLTEGKKHVFQQEYRVKTRSNKWCWCLCRGKVTTDDRGAPVRLAGTVKDISEQKKVEFEIWKLNEKLEQRVEERTLQLQLANKELKAFSYSVSHDLRAPLGVIDGFSLALLEDYRDKLDDDGKYYLERVRAGCQRMAQLIDDLLQFSRLTRGEFKRTSLNLSELAESVVNELYPGRFKHSVKFNITPNIQSYGDVHLLRIVLENLIGNSLKFTSKCECSIIEFNVVALGNETAYFVKDNGVGFNMDYKDKLFGAFQRLHSAEEFDGTGIGLATVQRIIHRHGGRVWAEGEVNKGAKFYFTLH